MAAAGDGSDRTESLARLALDRGQAALLAQDNPTALRWLDRAHRLVPTDPNVMLALATALIGNDAVRAAALFRTVADEHDVAQAFLGLAACHVRLDDVAGARAAIAHMLSRHALAGEAIGLIERVTSETGWCALRSDGRLEVHPPFGSQGKPLILLDGKPIAAGPLPDAWTRGQQIEASINGRELIGSPIRIDAIRRIVGCVEARDGGVTGWAWHPGDPGADPQLWLRWPALGMERQIVATERGMHVSHTGPLAQPRVFTIDRTELPAGGGLLHVLARDGTPLLGSPLDPLAEQSAHIAVARAVAQAYPASARNPSAAEVSPHAPLLADALPPADPVGADGRKRGVIIVMPVHDGGEVVHDCLRSLLASVEDARIIVVDDGSHDPTIVDALDRLAAAGHIRLLRNPIAQGFPAAANRGMQAAGTRDVLLLNSDTLLPPNWLPRLQAAAYSARDIGTVTPMSNDASILSYPQEAGRNPRPRQADVTRLDRIARRANGETVVDIPVGVGFCLFIRRDCLNAVGLFRSDVFAQGYGEENDFCLRARRLGWRNVALPGLFVGHLGGASFGSAATHLRARNGRALERLHPGHDALIADWLARDPLAEARRRIDHLRWNRTRAHRTRTQGSVILVTHNDGGGVEARVAASASAHRAAGLRPIVLRPARTSSGRPAVMVRDGTEDDFGNLIFAMPDEMPALLKLLRADRPHHVEVHHLVDFGAVIYEVLGQLGLPYEVFVHDYAWFCPRISLVDRDHYCGEPDLSGCAACVADHGHFLSEEISPAALVQRSAAFLAKARRVIVPADDVGTRPRRHFPGLATISVAHEDDAALPPVQPAVRNRSTVRICVVGGIGLHKGYDVVLACARDAAHRGLDLEFVIVGNTIDDARLMDTGRAFVTGRFRPEEAVDLIRRQAADLGFVASVCPETWCLTLSDIWRAGLPACSFDLGTPAERIRRTDRGFVLPVGLTPAAVNTVLMTTVSKMREQAASISVSRAPTRHVASGPPYDFAMHAQK